MYRKNCCTTPSVGGGGSIDVGNANSISKMLKFNVEVCLYVMGKALSGKLSCTQTGLVVVIL